MTTDVTCMLFFLQITITQQIIMDISNSPSPINNTVESTELLQARLDIHELQERVGILEDTLKSVLERLERQEMYGLTAESYLQPRIMTS